MLKYVIIGLSLIVPQLSFAAASSDKLGLSGRYLCSGYDEHDGAYSNAALTLTLDVKHSDFSRNYGAYLFKLVEPDGITYSGEVAANGNTAAIYFENTSEKALTDRGVGIAVITHDRDKDTHVSTVLHKFYYEPAYHGGGNGSETCVKLEDNKIKINKA